MDPSQLFKVAIYLAQVLPKNHLFLFRTALGLTFELEGTAQYVKDVNLNDFLVEQYFKILTTVFIKKGKEEACRLLFSACDKCDILFGYLRFIRFEVGLNFEELVPDDCKVLVNMSETLNKEHSFNRSLIQLAHHYKSREDIVLSIRNSLEFSSSRGFQGSFYLYEILKAGSNKFNFQRFWLRIKQAFEDLDELEALKKLALKHEFLYFDS